MVYLFKPPYCTLLYKKVYISITWNRTSKEEWNLYLSKLLNLPIKVYFGQEPKYHTVNIDYLFINMDLKSVRGLPHESLDQLLFFVSCRGQVSALFWLFPAFCLLVCFVCLILCLSFRLSPSPTVCFSVCLPSLITPYLSSRTSVFRYVCPPPLPVFCLPSFSQTILSSTVVSCPTWSLETSHHERNIREGE